LKKNSQKKAMQKPKAGEIYESIAGNYFIITGYNEDMVRYKFRNRADWSIYEQDWDWKKYPCRKLTSLEIELL